MRFEVARVQIRSFAVLPRAPRPFTVLHAAAARRLLAELDGRQKAGAGHTGLFVFLNPPF